MDGILAWLSALPYGALLVAMSALAAVENVFPPIPADAIVAFGGLLAARQGMSPWPAFLAVWLGNMAGVVLMFFLGRRYGTARLERRYPLDRTGGADQRVLALHSKYGTFAFFLSRFVPGVRAVVPPVAGALGIPFPRAMAAIAAASGLWYGLITWLAFRAGSNLDVLLERIRELGLWTAALAGAVLLSLGTWWYVRRKRRREHRPAA